MERGYEKKLSYGDGVKSSLIQDNLNPLAYQDWKMFEILFHTIDREHFFCE